MSNKKVMDKKFKLDAVQYRNDHQDLTWEEVANNLGVSQSSIRRWYKQFNDAKEK